MKHCRHLFVANVLFLGLFGSRVLGEIESKEQVSQTKQPRAVVPKPPRVSSSAELLDYQTRATNMLLEANFYAQKLQLSGIYGDSQKLSGLSGPSSITARAAKFNVNPPNAGGFGSIETKEYLYSFPGYDQKPITNTCGTEWFLEYGKLAYVIRKDPFPLLTYEVGNDVRERQRRLAGVHSQIDTNSAYQLATQWLVSVDVDVGALEKKYQPLSQQLFYYDTAVSLKIEEKPPADAKINKLPIFDITWGGEADCSPPVWVQINGDSKELIHLRMENTRFSKRRPLITNPTTDPSPSRQLSQP